MTLNYKIRIGEYRNYGLVGSLHFFVMKKILFHFLFMTFLFFRVASEIWLMTPMRRRIVFQGRWLLSIYCMPFATTLSATLNA